MKNKKGLNLLFLMQSCEGFSFYGLAAILTLFMVQFLHLSLSFAFLIFGVYSGLVYLSTLLGGYLSDTHIGSRYLINVGIISMILGLLILSYCGSFTIQNTTIHSNFVFNFSEIILIISLICVIIGEGFMRVNISATVPQLYKEESKEVESSFTLLTMAINIGALSASIILGLTIGEGNIYLYKYGFLILAISSIIALISYNLLRNKYLINPQGEIIGKKPIVNKVSKTTNSKITNEEKNNMKAIIIILLISLIFFIGFEVMDSTLMFFAKDNIMKVIPFIPFEISPEIIKFIEPFGVIIFSPIILWYFETKKENKTDLLSKIILGIMALFLVYLIFFIPCFIADTGKTNINIIFIIVMEFLRAISEILVLPIVLSLVSKLSPKQYLSRLMGLFYCSLAASYTLSGVMAGFYPNSTNSIQYLFGLIPIANFKSFCLIFIVIYLVLLIGTYLSKNKIKSLINKQ